MSDQINNITIIGAGNAATNLALAFRKAGKSIICVYNRHADKAKILADKVGAPYTNALNNLPEKSDLYLIAVSDEAITDVLSQLSGISGILAHTSGSTDMAVFKNLTTDYGVIYPLMHLSSKSPMDFTDIPVCVEACNPATYNSIFELAAALSNKVYPVNSAQRQILHLSAVFASNFTNLNYVISEEILRKHDLSFEIMHPIIIESAKKAMNASPAKLQTGPAVREDINVLKKHTALLNEFPKYQEMYKLLTEIIIQKKKNNEL